MRKSSTQVVSFSSLLFVFMLLAGLLQAQTNITIGTGTTGNGNTTYPSPLQDYFEGSRAQYLYRASELTAAGMGPGNINAIRFNVISLATSSNTRFAIERYTIKIGTTTTASLSATAWEPVTTTVFGPVDYTATVGVNTFNFITPFFWNGTDNIVVEVCNGDPNNATDIYWTGNPVVPWTTGLPFNGSHTYRVDNAGNLCNTPTTTNTGTMTTRPNIVFSWTSAAPCTGTPSGGTAVASPSTVCLGTPFQLSVTGATVASGITYQWQSSNTSTGPWTPITGATSAGLNTTQTASTYYRVVLTCTGGGSASSAPVQVVSPAAVSGTFTISKDPASPTNFQTFQDAVNFISCGINGPVIFNVKPGSTPFVEQVRIPQIPGASATNTIRFNGNGNTISFTSTNANERAGIRLDGADHVTIDSLIITTAASATTNYGYGIQLMNDADSNTISRSTINLSLAAASTNYAGIVVSASSTSATAGPALSDANTFSGNTINGGYYGITLIGNSTDAVMNNKVINNKINDWYQYGVYATGNFNTLIEGNDLSMLNRTATGTSVYGIYFTGLSVKAGISKNRIHGVFNAMNATNNDFYGIYLTGVDALAGVENTVTNNAIYDIRGQGSIYGLYNSGSNNVQYYFNTISLDYTASTATEITRGFHQVTTASGIDFRNNLISITRGGTGAKHAMYLSTAATTYASDYNNLFVSGTNGHVGYNGTDHTLLSSWQASTAKDSNSVAEDPYFTNLISGDLRPTSAALNDRGISITGITTDITNTARNSPPDIGAFEYFVPVCTTPPTPGTSTSTASAIVCPNTLVGLNLTGNSSGTNQTYRWESATSLTGPWTPITAARVSPRYDLRVMTTAYYRVAVTCSGNTAYSVPVLVQVAIPMAGGTYTINRNDPSADFQSFNAAYDAMKCGIAGPIVFNVASGSGPYLEQLVMDPIFGASAVNTITFSGNGNAIRFTNLTDTERAVIKLRGVDFITFDSLVVDALGTTYGYGIQLMADADSNAVRRSTINTSTTSTSTNYAGIVISNSNTSATAGSAASDGNVLSGNRINGGYYGITLAGSATEAVGNNVVLNNTIRDFYSYGIYLVGNFNTLVEGNDLSRPTRTNSTIFYGIYATGLSVKLNINKNRVHNPFDALPGSTSTFYGIYFTGVDALTGVENIVSNNAIYNVNGEGIQYGMYNTGSDNVRYLHNTISLDNASSLSGTAATYGFYQTTTASGIDLKNNLISVTRTGDGNRYGLYMNSYASTQYTSNHNNIFVSGNAGASFTGYNAVNRVTLADWQAATSQDANSVAINPLFTNPATGNLEPRNPALDNKGAGVGITTDIRGATRGVNNTYDIGAWEFFIPTCTGAPTPGNTLASPTSGICMGTPIRLTLSGNTTAAGLMYQWEYATSASGPWLPLGTPALYADTTFEASTSLFYRATATCGMASVSSVPVAITLNPAFLGGTYTINGTLPTGGTNFNTFREAVTALECGITDDVIFNVMPGTYTEQVRMKKIPGASANARVTFQGNNGLPASVTLQFAGTTTANYTLKLDSASYVTYRGITIIATNATSGRAVEFAGLASYDSLVNNVIQVPASTGTSNALSGVFADGVRGSNIVIRGNTITGGTNGIYFAGPGATRQSYNNVIDSNKVDGSRFYGIYTSFLGRVSITKNTVTKTSPVNTSAYGIYISNCDSAYNISRNRVNLTGITGGTAYGIYMTGNAASTTERGIVSSNTISALTGNTGTVYGMYQTTSLNNNTVNNVISINTTGTSSYALYSTGGGGNRYQNNSVNSTATSATNNVAAYFAHSSGETVDIRNNIFAHNGGGRALYITNPSFVYSDYNMLYTTGAVLVQQSTALTYANLQAWRDAATWDINSIVYKPAFVSNENLRPDITAPDVWAIHGRGVQIPENSFDFDNTPRPTTLAAGVPDLGAFEFLPTSIPPALPATPATSAAGTTQTFMFGTDTVSKITWNAGATVPSSITVRRYSGVVPPGLAGREHMYFYTDVDVTGTGPFNYDLQQFYIDSWQGLIPQELTIRLGRTDPANVWTTDSTSSSVDIANNVISKTGLTYLDKFTGLRGLLALPPEPLYVQHSDSSNRGKRFWVAYAHSYDFFSSSNSQNMVIYLSTDAQPATVTIRVTGTNWVKTYNIPAFTAISSDILPKTGLYDARLLQEGASQRGISIDSDVPITAYAHIYSSTNSGATMLLPVGVYGYEYYTLNARQSYSASNSHSSFFVIAERNNTKVEITPSNPTKNGRAANVPFTVTLRKGEVYQVLGAYISGIDGYDLSGSRIRSVPNDEGKCYPIAVFAGSTRTGFGCGGSAGGTGDIIFQQVFPSQAWGTRYLTAPTSLAATPSSLMTNLYRVMVKDPATVVRRNNTVLTGLINNRYYQFESNTADYIDADKPIMVAQYMSSSGDCPNTSGDGDPEMFYLSPIEQAIKYSAFYRNELSSIDQNYLTLVVPTGGMASLRIDNSSVFDHTYPHSRPGYTVVVKRWAIGSGQSIVQSDSSFTGIVYGLGSVESYGYNVGTLVKNLNALPAITNTFNTAGTDNAYTCAKTPFRFTLMIPIQPTKLEWQFSGVPGLSPNNNVVQNNPASVSTQVINGRTYYKYTITTDYQFSGIGTYNVPIMISHPDIEGCANTMERILSVSVIARPAMNYTTNFTNCIGDVAQFTGSGVPNTGSTISQYNWNFGDNTTGNGQAVTKQWTSPGSYNVSLTGIASDGCVGDTTKTVVVNPRPVVTLVNDSVSVCTGTSATFTVQNPGAGITYNWYAGPTGGTPIATGSSYTVNVSGSSVFYVEGVQSGCASTTRRRAVATILPQLVSPVVVLDSAGTNFVRFRWNAVQGTSGYEISLNGGSTWTTPTSGTTGLTHTVSGLLPLQSSSIRVRALGGCQVVSSGDITGRALPDDIFIPNSFSPNGDGLNDLLKVYGYTISDMQFMVFNQWGEKIFESRNQATGWDGRYKGQIQPAGVYIYVCRLTLRDGSVIQRKGSINLIR